MSQPNRGMTVTAMLAFAERNRLLTTLGYSSFDNYKNSTTLKRIERRALEKHPFCFGCGCVAEWVHFAFYFADNLAGKSEAGIWTICKQCYGECYFDEYKKRVSPEMATEALRAKYALRAERVSGPLRKRRYDSNPRIEEDVESYIANPHKGIVTDIRRSHHERG